MGKGWLRALRRKSRGESAEELTDVIREGGSAALFLKRPPAMLGLAGGKVGPRRSLSEGDDLMRALFTLRLARMAREDPHHGPVSQELQPRHLALGRADRSGRVFVHREHQRRRGRRSR